MINVFQLNYETRLKNWYDLRQKLQNSDTETKCVEIDKFWQSAPLVNHYLHPYDMNNWPGVWELLNENTYCVYARALGMMYTLLLLGVTTIDLVEAKDDNNEDVVLVLVDHAKYIMNYWPDMVVNNSLDKFTKLKYINIDSLKTTIGNV